HSRENYYSTIDWSTCQTAVKHSKDVDKGNGQSTQKSMVVDPAVDFGLQFTTDRMFKTRQQMQYWVCEEVNKLGFSAVVAKSDNGDNKRKPYVAKAKKLGLILIVCVLCLFVC
ncbi:hypothetical protein A2U01_0054844, partial [Trifolium medium]|nr:hypothetical protein [Trifolium medium]